LEKNAVVVCVATGNGLKDQESIETDLDRRETVADSKALAEALARLSG
jgi:threonine synthase